MYQNHVQSSDILNFGRETVKLKWLAVQLSYPNIISNWLNVLFP